MLTYHLALSKNGTHVTVRSESEALLREIGEMLCVTNRWAEGELLDSDSRVLGRLSGTRGYRWETLEQIAAEMKSELVGAPMKSEGLVG